MSQERKLPDLEALVADGAKVGVRLDRLSLATAQFNTASKWINSARQCITDTSSLAMESRPHLDDIDQLLQVGALRFFSFVS